MATLKSELQVDTLGPYEILDLLDQRQQDYAYRDQAYELYQRYYRGKQAAGSPSSVLGANSQGRPLLRVGEAMMRDRTYSSQRLAPIVDDAQALLGRMPSTRVEPPDPSPAGLERGELLTKYLVSTHELSSMERQQAEMGYFLPCLGDGCYVLEVEPELRRVVWTVVDPSTAYPSFRSGYRRYDMLDLIVHYVMDPWAARARWGKKFEPEDQNMVPVTIYLSPHQRSVIVGKAQPELVTHTDWNLRFCPGVWVFNKVNGRMANSDIAQSLTQQDALDFLWALFLDGAVQNTYPIIGVRNPLSVSAEPIQVGPGAPPVPLGPDGAITVANSQGALDTIQFGMQGLISDINVASGTSQLRQEGTMQSSIQTGRAAHALQGPQATRVELKQQELGAAIQKACMYTLEMQERAPLLGDHEFEIFGRWKGASFLQKMSGKDIDGWYRASVFWEPVTGMNQQQKTSVAYEAKAAGLIDSERAMEIMGEEDPRGMIQRVRAEKLAEAQLQAQIQGMLGGGAPPGGAGGGPPGQQGGAGPSAGMQGGGAAGNSQSPPPSMVVRPRGLGGPPSPPPGQQDQGITREKVEETLKLVADKLKGSVAIVGAIAKVGQASHVELLVSDFRDTQRVGPVIKALDPAASIKVKDEADWPDNAIRVA